MRTKRIIAPGTVFTRLTVVEPVGRYYPPLRRKRTSYVPMYSCRCECGVTRVVRYDRLVSGLTKSCGCYQRETVRVQGKKNRTHGESHESTEYRTWQGMKLRCTQSPASEHWKYYAGRGITVCDEWKKSFPAFLAHIGRRPSPAHSLDRINNDGNYEPGNVRWATLHEQHINKRPPVKPGGLWVWQPTNLPSEYRRIDDFR